MDISLSTILIITELSIASIIGIVIVFKILYNNPKNRANQIFSGVVICLFLGVLATVINLSLRQAFIYVFGHFIWILGSGCMFLYMLLFFKPEKMVKRINQTLIILLFVVLGSILFFMMDDEMKEIQGAFQWTLPMMLYNTVVLSSFLAIYVWMMRYGLKNFKEKETLKKVKFIGLAGIIYFIILISVAIVNYINIPVVRLVWSIIEGIAVLGAILAYMALDVKVSSKHRQLVLTYFDQSIGPKIYFSFPETFPDELIAKLKKYFDIEEKFFEVRLIEHNLTFLNLYFEIPSEMARGGVEMVMLSLVTSKLENNPALYEVLKFYTEKINRTREIFKCFYKEYDAENKCKNKILKNLIIECFSQLNLRKPSIKDESKIVEGFKKFEW